jgi:hypothetical protein
MALISSSDNVTPLSSTFRYDRILTIILITHLSVKCQLLTSLMYIRLVGNWTLLLDTALWHNLCDEFSRQTNGGNVVFLSKKKVLQFCDFLVIIMGEHVFLPIPSWKWPSLSHTWTKQIFTLIYIVNWPDFVNLPSQWLVPFLLLLLKFGHSTFIHKTFVQVGVDLDELCWIKKVKFLVTGQDHPECLDSTIPCYTNATKLQSITTNSPPISSNDSKPAKVVFFVFRLRLWGSSIYSNSMSWNSTTDNISWALSQWH